jgi:hypothetical protein
MSFEPCMDKPGYCFYNGNVNYHNKRDDRHFQPG